MRLGREHVFACGYAKAKPKPGFCYLRTPCIILQCGQEAPDVHTLTWPFFDLMS